MFVLHSESVVSLTSCQTGSDLQCKVYVIIFELRGDNHVDTQCET